MTATTSEIITADQLATQWTALWNGSYELAETLCATDFRISFGATGEDGVHSGDAVRGPAQFVEFLRAFRDSLPGVWFGLDGGSAGTVDANGTGLFAARWYVNLPNGESHSGIDMLEAVDAKLTHVWSVTGERRFPAH